ncbi:MAG: undecaprenyl-diphosphate phosphatase [Puniceicoccales bacterium]|jgi:undecaprenyl-diphosphatase|nr:undecaprenyl-diphosphate phosphatase [Puniceicoccales bacterium]
MSAVRRPLRIESHAFAGNPAVLFPRFAMACRCVCAVFGVVFVLMASSAVCAGKAFPDEAPPPPSGAPTTDVFGYKTAVILGTVEGLTEYLPVSSTGHLILANEFLGLKNSAASPSPSGENKVPSSLESAADAYVIVIQFGAILAVLFAYWGRVRGLVFGLFAGKRESFLLTRNIVIAFLPAAFLGFLFNKHIEAVLFGVRPVIFALFTGALVMLGVEFWYRRRRIAGKEDGGGEGPEMHELTASRALGIGVAQCFALWPGMSRSMVTICGGYLAGLRPARATEFSFLLGLVTLTCASVYKTIGSGGKMLAAFDLGPLVAGIVTATFTSFFAVKWMVGWINRHGLSYFAWYRIVLAIALYIYFRP